MIAERPHPYIIKYYGCLVESGLIRSLVFERLAQTLIKYTTTPGVARLDKGIFFKRLVSAFKHLHSLGLAHNDLNPANVMIRESENGQVEPVLIDFGSCALVSEKLQFSARTPGWYMEEFETSEEKHDIYALDKMERWLHAGDSKCICS
jgi:serine/threonine protein kinase